MPARSAKTTKTKKATTTTSTPTPTPTPTKKPTKPARRPTPAAGARTAADRALAERMLQRLRGGADLRTRKVRRIRAAIKVRHYENGLKLAVAIERMAGAAGRLRS